MTSLDATTLSQSHCAPCEGGVPPLSNEQVQGLLRAIPNWSLEEDGKSIARRWKLKSFAEGLQRIQAIGRLAEQEQHHPDLHLTGYRHLKVVLTTHAIGGLSQNDFILAAKIDESDT